MLTEKTAIDPTPSTRVKKAVMIRKQSAFEDVVDGEAEIDGIKEAAFSPVVSV